MFDAVKYLRERRVEFTSEGHGWINMPCPICRSWLTGSNPKKAYLGFNLAEGYFHCWRCGGHSAEAVIMAIERVEYHEACGILIQYESDFNYRLPPGHTVKQAQGLEGVIEWPSGTLPLQPGHKAYLASRGFDPDYLEVKYRLMGTVNAGAYAARIMVPIFFCGKWVSYQGRDITGKSDMKYKACRKDLELVAHNEILYNLDNAAHSAIIVEGVFDVWRLGDGAVATFGTSIEPPQVRLISERFKRVAILLDSEPKAQTKARWLASQLAAMGIEVKNVKLKSGDPGSMSQEDANKLKEQLL